VELAWGRGYARPFLFVDDAVAAIRAALAAPGFPQPFYNIAGPDHVEIAQLAELVARQVPGARIALGEGPPPGGDRRGRLDLRAATRDFGYRPSVDIAAGVARYAAWMRAGSPPYFGSRV
jgi:nucleoside-diphosphate-sugar epimerase